jgi:hypothetical protein
MSLYLLNKNNPKKKNLMYTPEGIVDLNAVPRFIS